MKHISFLDKPCERCGSKKRVAKTWTENMVTFTGTTKVEYSQIVCTNKECQRLFEENLEKETKLKQTVKLQREAREKARLATSHITSKKTTKKN